MTREGGFLSRPFWTEKKIKILSWTLIAGVLFHIFTIYISDSERGSLLKRGDFPAFYSSAMILRQGLGDRLYDTELLKAVQNLYWPSFHGGYISSPYPPYVPAMLLPLAFLPPDAARTVYAVMMIIFLCLAFFVMTRLAPALKKYKLEAAAFCLSFFPLTFGVLGGQNISLSMFLYAAMLRTFSKNTKSGDLLCGLCLGLWFFKPQFAALFVFYFVLARCWRIVATALSVAGIYYLIAAVFTGPAWPLAWFKAAQEAAALDFPFNQTKMISITGFLKAMMGFFPAHPQWGSVAGLAGAFISALLFLGLAWLYHSIGQLKGEGKRARLQALLEFTAPVALLISPHALFYDLPLCLVPYFKRIRLDTDGKISLFIFVTAFTTVAIIYKEMLIFQPAFFLLLASAAFFYSRLNPKF